MRVSIPIPGTPRGVFPTIRGGAGGKRRLLWSVALLLATGIPSPPAPAADPTRDLTGEAHDTGWALYVDNDLLLGTGRDQQYTGGMALTLSGRRAAEYWWSLDPALGRIDAWTGFARQGAGAARVRRHSTHFGVAAFTPENTRAQDPLPGDRPYASIAFISNTRQRVRPRAGVSYQSSLIVGALGTNVVPKLQVAIHSARDGDEPRGWDNQISDGGELTANYVVARHDLLALHQAPGVGDYQVQTVVGAGVGFATEVGIGINARYGRYSSPWWVFVPDYAQYIGLGTPISGRVSGSESSEFFVWGGLNLRYSIYSALLQGQFRDSAVTYDRDQLRPLVAEASIGVTLGLGAGTHITMAFRGRTPEIRNNDDSYPLWGSLVLSRTY